MASHTSGDGGIPPRDAHERGLKRVMTLGGAYGTRNYTVRDLREHKGQRVLTETLPFSVAEAMAAEEAGFDTLKVRFDPGNPDSAAAIRQAAPNTFMAFSVPLVAAATADAAAASARLNAGRCPRCTAIQIARAVRSPSHGTRRVNISNRITPNA